MRIVSLVPSTSHTLAQIPQLLDQMVACTSFCMEPAGLQKKMAVVGGTKDANLEAIRALKPTHILVNHEENTKEIVEGCREICPTLESFPKSCADVVTMFEQMAAFLDVSEPFVSWQRELTALMQEWKHEKQQTHPDFSQPKRFAYFIWQNPFMLTGRDTFISNTLEFLGWDNALSASGEDSRYPVMNLNDIAALNPDILAFSSEPFPFRKRHIEKVREEWEGKAVLFSKIDGQLLSWHGYKTIELFQSLLGRKPAVTSRRHPQKLLLSVP